MLESPISPFSVVIVCLNDGMKTTNATGNFTLTLTGLVSGDSLTATATIGNNTSVFAAALLVK